MPEAEKNVFEIALERETTRLKEKHAVRRARGEVSQSLKPVPDRAWFEAQAKVIENQPRPADFEQKRDELLAIKEDLQLKGSNEAWLNILDNLDDLIMGRPNDHEDLLEGWRKKDKEDLRDAIL